MTPQTDREALLDIADSLERAEPVGRHGDWVELSREAVDTIVAQLRAIARRPGDGCDINLHIGTVLQGEPETFRATRTGYDSETGTYTFTIVEGEATNEQA